MRPLYVTTAESGTLMFGHCARRMALLARSSAEYVYKETRVTGRIGIGGRHATGGIAENFCAVKKKDDKGQKLWHFSHWNGPTTGSEPLSEPLPGFTEKLSPAKKKGITGLK